MQVSFFHPITRMMNANLQPVNPPANVGHQQQQAHQLAGNNTPQYIFTKVKGLLKVIEDILPVHEEEWEDVLQAHAPNFPNSQHTAESLKHKFQQLYRVKRPIGDPFYPIEVRMAKYLHHLITTKCEINDAKGGPLPPGVSFDDDVVGDENIIEDEDDKAAAHNVVEAEVPPVVVAPVARANGVLAPSPKI
jgi:hypothetical protein